MNFMAKLISICVIILLQFISICQPIVEWELSLGGSNLDTPYAIIENEDGSIVIFSSTRSNDIDSLDHKGDYDVWIVKLNSTGQVLWQKSYGGSKGDFPYSAQKTEDGGYIISGESASSDGDISSGNQGGFGDAWLIKLDNSGNLEWEKTYGGSGWDRGWSVLQNSESGYFLLVETNSSDGDVLTSYGESDFWLLKVDSIGVLEWQRTFGGSFYDFPWKLRFGNDGNLILTGDSGSEDGDVNGTLGMQDVWVITVSTQGEILSNRLYGGSKDEYLPNIFLHGDSDLTLCASSYSMDGDLTLNHGNRDLWVVSLDNNGNIQWERNYGVHSMNNVLLLRGS